MKKNKTLIIVIVSLATVLLIYFIAISTQKQKYDWLENYHAKGMQPYGTGIIEQLLKTYHPGKKLIVNDKKISQSLHHNDSTLANYVFVGNDLVLDSADLATLLKFVEDGNTAFISSKSMPDSLISVLYKGECGEWEDYAGHKDSVVHMNFYDTVLFKEKGYRYQYKYRNITSSYDWQCIDGGYFCDSTHPFIMLGYVDSNYVNYIQLPYGKGSFLFHTAPMAFANYQLLQEESLEYAGKVFSYLNDGNIYWDEYSKLYQRRSQIESGFSESPLKYILSQSALRWAWYLTLVLIFLYILFHAKRKQRAIPVLEPNVNTSLEFVKTIGVLYHQQNNPKKICAHKMKLFLAFIRNRYYLQTNTIDEQLMQRISQKSTLPYTVIEKIFQKYKFIDACVTISESDLVEFHQSVEHFYKNCK
jgi:hypothetical protein